jgi:hypothetical protein
VCHAQKKTLVHVRKKVHALSGWVKRGGASLARGAHSELDGHTHLVHLLKQSESLWEMWFRREDALMLMIQLGAACMRVTAGGDVASSKVLLINTKTC